MFGWDLEWVLAPIRNKLGESSVHITDSSEGPSDACWRWFLGLINVGSGLAKHLGGGLLLPGAAQHQQLAPLKQR